MAQQTAVEWLIEQLHSESYQNAFGRTYVSPVIIDEAKAMEKEKMEKMYNHAMLSLVDTGHGETFDEYYKRIYEK